MTRTREYFHLLLPAAAAGTAWFVGLVFVFGAAQPILSNANYQSGKFLAVLFEIEPLPRMTTHPEILFMACAIFGMIHAILFRAVMPALPQKRIKRGLSFGCMSWAFCFPWFEYYLPWNVMHEPWFLVIFELFLWLIVMLVIGVALSFTSLKASQKN